MAHELNAKLRALDIPERMRRLPIDERGFLVPWFVAWIDGKPDHRTMDGEKLRRAIQLRLCWNCGGQLGARGAFVLGPMCAVNRTNAEPPSHYECAAFAVCSCPHLSQPKAQRRGDPRAEYGTERTAPSAGFPILRNPGVMGIWVTKRWQTYDPRRVTADAGAGVLFHLGDPERVEWYALGRPATRAEVEASVEGGLPLLQQMADDQEREEPRCGASAELARMVSAFRQLLPAV